MLIAEEDLWRAVTAECERPCPAAEPQATVPLPGLSADTLAGRQSVREFSAEPVPTQQLAAAHRAAQATDLRILAPGADFGVAIAAIRVEAQESGIFMLEDSLAEDDLPSRPCLAQPELSAVTARYADAPALFLVYGAPGAGPHAYSGLLARAGAFGYNLWLAGRTEGLEGCVYGGAMPRITTMLTTTAGRPLRHLFTVALGKPRR